MLMTLKAHLCSECLLRKWASILSVDAIQCGGCIIRFLLIACFHNGRAFLLRDLQQVSPIFLIKVLVVKLSM